MKISNWIMTTAMICLIGSGVSAEEKPKATSVVGNTYRWSQVVEGEMDHWELTFFDDGQYVRAHWFDEASGKPGNPQLEYGAWKEKGSDLVLQEEAYGGEYGVQWVYVKTTYQVADKGLIATSYIVHDKSKVLDKGVPGRKDFPKAAPLSPEKFKSYYDTPFTSDDAKEHLNIEIFRSKTMKAYPYKWQELK